MAGRRKDDEGPRKKPLGTKLDGAPLLRLKRTVARLPRDWTINRILEEGAARILDDLEAQAKKLAQATVPSRPVC